MPPVATKFPRNEMFQGWPASMKCWSVSIAFDSWMIVCWALLLLTSKDGEQSIRYVMLHRFHKWRWNVPIGRSTCNIAVQISDEAQLNAMCDDHIIRKFTCRTCFGRSIHCSSFRRICVMQYNWKQIFYLFNNKHNNKERMNGISYSCYYHITAVEMYAFHLLLVDWKI